VAEYVGNGAWRAMGTTDSNGLTSVEIFPVNTNFRMTYNFTTKEQTQNLASDPVVVFQTVDATVRLETCAHAGLSGGVVDYVGNGAWRAMGTTDGTGEVHKELFDIVTNFRITYNFITSQVNGQATSTPLMYSTTNVTMHSNLAIQYVGNGAWRPFTQPSMELLPGNYHFRAGSRDFYLDVTGCSLGGNLVIVSLFNGAEVLSPPDYSLSCTGVGDLGSGVYFTNSATWQCRGKSTVGGTIYGPYLYFPTLNTILDYEFATVTVDLFNGGDHGLDSNHKVEVTGVGTFTDGQVFHAPPGANLQYRLVSVGTGTINGPWLYHPFAAGDSDWELEFATVTVDLFNGVDHDLDNHHKVEVTGVGTFSNGDAAFHVPPGTNLQYRLVSVGTGTINGPWLYHPFAAGDSTWSLEFATVTVKFDLPPDVKSHLTLQFTGVGTFGDGAVFHVPPGANIQYRLVSTGPGTINGPWLYQAFLAGDGMFIWGLTPEYVHAP
jgi:hypothetical protein